MDPPDFISSKEAIALLKIRPATLYTYVSRGLVRTREQPAERGKLYARADVERLRIRSKAMSGTIARSQETMHWGTPIISTSIIDINAGGPIYRGVPAIDLANSVCTFEAVSEMLWLGQMTDETRVWTVRPSEFDPDTVVDGRAAAIDDLVKLFATIVLRMNQTSKRSARGDQSPFIEAQQIIGVLAGCCGYLSPAGRYVAPRPGERIARTLARAFGVSPTKSVVQALNAALILCADLELAPGTFTARIAASAGADLHSCIAAGLCAHNGALTGRGTDRVETLFGMHGRISARMRNELLRGASRQMLGFNHPLFPNGDVRAQALIKMTRGLRELSQESIEALAIVDGVAAEGSIPGVGIGLVILALGLRLPSRAALAIWTIARVAGQTAHVIEQRTQGALLRPRARYRTTAN